MKKLFAFLLLALPLLAQAPPWEVGLAVVPAAASNADQCNTQSGFLGTQKNANESILIGPMDVTGINSNSASPLTNVIAIGGVATASNQTVIGNTATTNTFLFGIVNQPLHTPASSSEACTAGDHADDASYHYVCTATNTWKRVALSAF